MLAGFISTPAQASGFSMGNSKPSAQDTRMTTNRPWGNYGAAKPAPMYQPPPPPPNIFYRGAAPAPGWYAAQLPVNSTATTGLPVVEVDVEGSVFYEQQNIIYTVHVVSDGNIKSLNPELPRIDGAALEQLDGPVLSTRTGKQGNKRQIINTYRYKLMPLRSGEIVIPAISFIGTHAQSRQQPRGPGLPATAPAGNFNIAADAALTLQVRPADPAVNPWLPLHDLRLQAHLAQQGPAKAGKPVTLTLELQAKGALGNQLPSLARQLESKNYRIYRDSTTIKNAISANGDGLVGSRKETYVIMPLEDGWIRLPAVSLAWWDVDTHTAMLAELPFGHAGATAAGAGSAATSAAGQSLFPYYFWAPMVIALALIAGMWLGVWQRTRPLVKSAGAWLSARARNALQHARGVGGRLSPASHLRWLKMGLAVAMPGSIKLWMCTRCLQAEDSPDAWCTQFKSRVCQHLDIAMHSSLTHVTEKIISTSPQADPARLRALAHSLDAAIYGGNALDFPAWKRELSQQLRPRLLRRRQSQRRHTKTLLPALNPRSA